jgi:uncharacterized protein YcbK (DUF882 family)
MLGAIALGLSLTSGLKSFKSKTPTGTVGLPVAASTAQLAMTPVETVETTKNETTVYTALPELTLFNVNTKQSGGVRLYDEQGYVDENAANFADTMLADARRKGKTIVRTIDRRLLQILVRSAYHFRQSRIEIVSGYRQPMRRREGYHALGRAVDYRILGVTAGELASYLRQIPRLGVGVYTHPKTEYVHLDVREVSFHWLDASPPRRRWRERSLSDRTLVELDKRYSREGDWPEGFCPPPDKPKKP